MFKLSFEYSDSFLLVTPNNQTDWQKVLNLKTILLLLSLLIQI